MRPRPSRQVRQTCSEDLAMKGMKLITRFHLQNAHEKSLPPKGARRRMELEYRRVTRIGLACKACRDHRDRDTRADTTIALRS
jgi:hypothetical protein